MGPSISQSGCPSYAESSYHASRQDSRIARVSGRLTFRTVRPGSFSPASLSTLKRCGNSQAAEATLPIDSQEFSGESEDGCHQGTLAVGEELNDCGVFRVIAAHGSVGERRASSRGRS